MLDHYILHTSSDNTYNILSVHLVRNCEHTKSTKSSKNHLDNLSGTDPTDDNCG